ncbi:MAG: ATP synthase F1 subunit delta [Acidimicrobiia bacterium]
MSVQERIDAYANALLEVARAEGHLAGVEDDLFRFARVFEGSDELRLALTDPQLPAERRMAIVEELMGGKALATSAALASFVVGVGRGTDLPEIVEAFVLKAAHVRNKELAEVRSALPLDDGQRSRLAEALAAATGKQVELKVIIDPSVLGGLVARIGDTVIDGTVRHRLDQLREQV